jgi:hypothetical protein
MAIVVSQLISAAVLQLPFVDKQGDPLTNGVVTFYQSDMVTFKNIYYQASPGNYIAAPNPLTLSGAGTPMDVNGNDIILFYYPYSETDANISQPYFVTVYDEFGTLQFTRFNFPWINGGESAVATVATLENYVINSRFWRNIGTLDTGTINVPNTSTAMTSGTSWTTQYNTTGNYYHAKLCPDQHDSFSMPDVNYIKNFNGNATETITFNTFTTTNTPILTGDIGPEYYINFNCSADTSGSTLKVFQFPISLHLATLAAEPFSFTIQGQSISGTATIGIYIYQFCGTGATSPNPVQIGTITFGANWTKFTLTGKTFAGTVGLTLPSANGDDAYYLQIAMPTGSTAGICNLNFTLPSIYLSSTLNDIPTNSFATYDQIDSIINSPRTGDIRTSMNQFYYYGWVPLNGGTIGNVASAANPRNNIDAWPLFNLLWNTFSPYGATVFPIYTSGTQASATTYGTSALLDWNANKAIALSKMMGQVILGNVPMSALLTSTAFILGNSDTFTASSSSGLLITTAQAIQMFKGMPIVFSTTSGILPTGITANTIYYVTADSSYNGTTTFHISTTFANAMAGTAISWTDNGTAPNTISFAPSGASEGESAHIQLTGEVGPHTHPNVVNTTGSGVGNIPPTGSEFAGNTGTNTPNSVPFNVMQPSTLYNIFMKL